MEAAGPRRAYKPLMSRAIYANRAQVFLLPPSLDEWVPQTHPVRFVADLVDSLNLEALGFRASPGDEGRPHYAAEVLLGVWLYGWMERVRSSRSLEKACQRDMAFVWLTSNLRPDHITLWRFFRDNKKALKKLFVRVVRIAAESNLIGFALHALDGTKVQAASSMESASHRTALKEELKKLEATVDASVEQIEADEQQPAPDWKMPQTLADKEERKKRIRAELAKLDEADTDHLHSNEPEARVMKTREGARLGYNAQAVVDHASDLVVAIGISGDQTDHEQLVPMTQAVHDTFGDVADHTVADAGYASGTQFEEAERRHLPVLVNVQQESSEKGDFAKSQFTYEAERDVYVCPRDEVLPFDHIEPPSKGKPQARRVYRCHKTDCPVRSQCTTNKRGREIKRLLTEPAFERQVARQSGPDERFEMSLRKQIIEHLFGNVKFNHGFRRFTAFGLAGAAAQWALICLAVNLRKLLPAWRDGRLMLAPA
jgi:transposase